MLYSRVNLLTTQNQPMTSRVVRSHYDPDDVHSDDTDEDHEDDDNSNDASMDNFYDAPAESMQGIVPEVRINMDPSDRLIEAIGALREAITENTTATQRQRQRARGPRGSGTTGYKGGGGSSPLSLKDERLKIRKEKVSRDFTVFCHHFSPTRADIVGLF